MKTKTLLEATETTIEAENFTWVLRLRCKEKAQKVEEADGEVKVFAEVLIIFRDLEARSNTAEFQAGLRKRLKSLKLRRRKPRQRRTEARLEHTN